tara:strand:- start:399 stop:662 length:264 start_codon:yes stop_codon:yes gene_type:complete
MKNPLDEKQFFVIEKDVFLDNPNYRIHNRKMYRLTDAIKKMLALDSLNEDRERISYHLQEVNFSMVKEPLELTKEIEVKEQQSELPF